MDFSKEMIDKTMTNGGIFRVEFTKTDGTNRVFENATVSMERIPAESHPKGTSTKKPNVTSKSVWIIGEGKWGSFRYDSIKSFEEVTPK